MESGVFIIAEVVEGRITKETFELVSFGRELSRGLLPTIILLGNKVEEQAHELALKTGCDIIAVVSDDLRLYNTLIYCDAVLDILPRNTPSFVCLAHTSMGYDLAPRLAVKMRAACITTVEAVSEGVLSRAVCSGRFIVDIVPRTTSVVVTVLPGAFTPFVSDAAVSGSVRTVRASLPHKGSKTLALMESIKRDSTLKDAEVIVAAGRGVGKKENIRFIKELASMFLRSALGASRAVCDLGWLEYSRQIGTTGQSVSPRLYIACGISGAIQHVYGMKGSKTIIAINTDPFASIFHVAQYCIVEDLTRFIPVLIEEMKRASASGSTRC